MQDPYQRTEHKTFSVEGRLHVQGGAEFLGVRNHPDRPPTSALHALGMDLTFVTPQEAAEFAAAAQVMANQHHIAWERAGLIPARESADRVAPR